MAPAEPIARAQDFIWRNARILERNLFAFHFAYSHPEPVLWAMRPYRNYDGGFGNALEPDKRDPNSQPVDCEMALHILDDVDALDLNISARMCNFLQKISTAEGGVPLALPSVNDYPHAPWWAVEENPPASLNPTAAIAGLFLKHDVEHPWVNRATEFCWQAIERADTTEFHTLMPVVTFLEHAPDTERAKRDLERIADRVAGSDAVAMDPDAAGYAKKPLDWAPTPDSFFRRIFADDLVERHLDALAAQQQPDGGWPVPWETISPGVELEWRGWLTIEALKTLRAYGRL